MLLRKLAARPLIYVAGPLSQGVVATNIRTALLAAEQLWELGFVPHVPHLTHFWNFALPHEDTRHEDAFWMQLDFAMLEHCDCMMRLPGPSIGADMEEDKAQSLGIPIFHDVSEAEAWIGFVCPIGSATAINLSARNNR
ncbi:MAG: DUF4406 domain-containing protein [Chloroflexi bacterium]|nr:DUF4406 domain-containing protein [Chloroflexota bacterium]